MAQHKHCRPLLLYSRGSEKSPGILFIFDKYITIIYDIVVMEVISLPGFEGFDWDKGNIEKNWITHEVTQQEAEQVFFNSPLIAAEDPQHSHAEQRLMVLGQTDKARYLFIAFMMRNKSIRVISARDMSRKERKIYLS